jgi:uncharacterized protein YbjT (DUF2867 family)
MTARRPRQCIAVVAGASGLVGSELLRRLLRGTAYDRVVALTRRPLGRERRLIEVPAQYNALDSALERAVPKDALVDAYCCLGTTIKAAGSAAAFRKVDFDYVVAFGRWAARHPARRLVVISALAADATSRVFYSRVKGEAEDALRQLAGAALVLLRPSLLDGPRQQRRIGESLALAFARPLRNLLPAAVRPVRVEDVAQSMIDAARKPEPAAVLGSAAMHGAAERADTQRSAAASAQSGPSPS